MLKRLSRQGTATHWSHQAETLSRRSPQSSWQCFARTGSVAKFTRIVVTCVVIFLGLTFEAFTQSPSRRNGSAKERVGTLQCAAELERLSYAIAVYLGDRDAQRKMSVSRFAEALQPALPPPLSDCNTDTVKSVLMNNPFFRMTPSVKKNDRVMGFLFANDELLIELIWGDSLRAFVKDGLRGRVKMLPYDYRY